MAMFFKKKISVIQYYLKFRICFDLFVLNFRNMKLKSAIFFMNHDTFLHFATAVSPRKNNYGMRKKIFKIKDIQNAPLSMHY